MKNRRTPIIGIMGPANTKDTTLLLYAEKLGKQIAENGWILLTGGRKAGVMDSASKGARNAGGVVLGILPGDDHSGMSEHVTIPVLTGMGHARNVINILTSDVVIICGMGNGTASEAALALKQGKSVIFTHVSEVDVQFFSRLIPLPHQVSNDIDEIISMIREHLH